MSLDGYHHAEAEKEKRDATDTIVDLSNVTRSTLLGGGGSCCANAGAHLSRLSVLSSEWSLQFGVEPHFLLIADSSLRSALCEDSDRFLLSRWQRSGALRMVPYADPEILETAHGMNASILSRDQFKPFRRIHEWIAEEPERFVHWTRDDIGIRLIRSLPDVWEGEVSRYEEEDEFRNLHIPTSVVARMMGKQWRCENHDCVMARLWPERLLIRPSAHGASIVCPGCRNLLIDAGESPRATAVKVSHSGVSRFELLLTSGDEVILGRGGEDVVDVGHGAADRSSVSRKHVGLRCKGGLVEIRDLGSSNGTRRSRWNTSIRALAPIDPVGSTWTPLGRRDLVHLSPSIAIRLSGRRWPLADGIGPRADDDDEKTRFPTSP